MLSVRKKEWRSRPVFISEVLETSTYDPFGKRTVYNATGQPLPDTDYANPHGYTGREHLPLAGLMDYRN